MTRLLIFRKGRKIQMTMPKAHAMTMVRICVERGEAVFCRQVGE